MKVERKDPNANKRMCFENQATALCPRRHTEGFSLCPHRTSHIWNLHRRITTLHLEYTTPLSNTTTSTQEARHKAKQQSPLHKRDKALSQTTITSTQRGMGTKPTNNHLCTKRDKGSKPNHNHLYTRGMNTNPK